MGSEIAILERQLVTVAPRFDDLLRGSMMDSKALIAGVMIAVERTPRLLECTPQSLLNCTNTAAALRLPFDGASGQFFPLPFRSKGIMVAQPCVGYKGFNTIGARGGLAINAGVVREGDIEWDYQEGTGGFVRHKKKLDNEGRIIAAWATGSANGRPNVVSVMGIGEVEELMNRSPAYRNGADTPWKDKKVGFIAMCEKSPRRRLSRSIPWEIDSGRYLLAARLDEAFDEQGRHSFIGDKGLVVEGDNSPLAAREPSPTPTVEQLTGPIIITTEDPTLATIQREGVIAADEGVRSLEIWFGDLPKEAKRLVKPFLDAKLKSHAVAADRRIREELETEYLPMKLEELKTVLAPDLEAFCADVKKVLTGHADLLARFDTAHLEHAKAGA